MGKWGWFPLIGSILGALVLVFGFPSASSAPQEAVVVALSAALAIIPYVFARAISEIIASEKGQSRRAESANSITRELPRSEESNITDDSNGLIHVPVIFRNPADASKALERDFLVDTNIAETLVPGHLLDAIDIASVGKREYILADGSKGHFDFAIIEMEVMGTLIGATVLFVRADSEPTIGRISLASAGLEVDPISGTVKKGASTPL